MGQCEPVVTGGQRPFVVLTHDFFARLELMESTVALRPDEQIVRQFSISPRFFGFMLAVAVGIAGLLPAAILGLLSLLTVPLAGTVIAGVSTVGLLAGLLLAGYAVYLRAARFYVLTNQRIIETVGWLAKQTVSADYGEITDLRVNQDIFERLLNVGLLAVNTAGADIEEIKFERISHPYGLSNQIRQLCEARLRTHPGNGRHPQPPPVRTTSPVRPV